MKRAKHKKKPLEHLAATRTKSDRLFTGIVLFVAIFLIAQNLLLLGSVARFMYHDTNSDASGKATGSVQMCFNARPVIDLSGCSATFNQSTALVDNAYECVISIIDEGGYTISATEVFEMNTTLTGTTLSLNGFQASVGLHQSLIEVVDNSGCDNNNASSIYTFTVLDINDPPNLESPIPDQTLQEDILYSVFWLNDYFDDPDGDTLNFSVTPTSSVNIVIVEDTGEVLIRGSTCAEEYVIFTATDPGDLSAQSNLVRIKVNCRQEVQEETTSPSSSSVSITDCTSLWKCADWGACLRNGTQRRKCVDIYACDPNEYKKYYWQECEYLLTCFDGEQNQGEEGVDCGGPCPACGNCTDGQLNNEEEEIDCGGPYCAPCQNCHDGIRNYDEVGVDCGGPICEPCETCFDGIKNQDEEGVDCGGPCSPCIGVQSPSFFEETNPVFSGVIMVGILSVAVLAVLYRAFSTKINKALVTLGWFLLSSFRKQILIRETQKNDLLVKLAALENKLLSLGNDPAKDALEKLLDSLMDFSRFFFSQTFDLAFEYESNELLEEIRTKIKSETLQKIFLSFNTKVSEFEFKHRRVTFADIPLLIEELRMLVYQISVVEERDVHRVVQELDLEGNPVERIKLGVRNALLALEFQETEIAKRKYFELKEVFDPLTQQQKDMVFYDLHRLFLQITYSLTWAKK
ncbi:MAG: hypothetical protein H6502_01910 [Candidatus Woesearchaeota archaeon]|nr:MAG: hypothetical protein H6502_01910 [Candidatus Woesearchaeota archaeon]